MKYSTAHPCQPLSLANVRRGPEQTKRINGESQLLPLSAADLFDILLPMLNIYQEFVRNHQYSLQILAHCKQNRDFDKLLKHYEAKPDCEERTLETFLTYPMFQVTVADSPQCPSPAPALCCAAEPCSALCRRSPGTS